MDNIPQEVIDEIHSNFKNVIFEIGSYITPITRTFMTNYTNNDEIVQTKMMNEDFDMVDTKAKASTKYKIRGDVVSEDGETFVVRRIDITRTLEAIE